MRPSAMAYEDGYFYRHLTPDAGPNTPGSIGLPGRRAQLGPARPGG